MGHDLIVRGGFVVDGSGRPGFTADIGVRDGRIAAIGKVRDPAARVLNAEGLVVAPGFIDVHTHMDCQVFWDPIGASSCWQGVTTAVMGNCGFTIAPGRDDEKGLSLRSMERAEDIPLATMYEGIPWGWETYSEYLDVLEGIPKGINYAGYVGHNAIRTYVMGQRAFSDRATPDDLVAMCDVLEGSLRAGAWGFSTTRSRNHRLMTDDPVPSGVADWEEVSTLVRRMGDLGVGIFELAPEWYDDDPERTKTFFSSLQRLATESGRPVTMASGQREPLGWDHYARFFEDVAASGGRAYGQVGTRNQMLLYGFNISLPFDGLPGWREMRSQSLDVQRAVLEQPDRRRALVDEALSSEYRRGVSAEPRPPDYDDIKVVDSPEGPWRSVAEVAAALSQTPVDVMVDLSLASGFDQMFVDVFANRDWDVLGQMLSHPWTVIGDGDAGAHATQISDASFFTSFLAEWVGRRQAFTLEEGVRMCSFDQARLWGFADRGLIRTGLAADLVVFDPASIGPGSWFVDRDLPADAKRIKQKATGIAATLVNGVVVTDRGEHTGASPGRVLRGPLAR